MANLLCPVPLQGETVRATRLDECGAVEFGACAFGVSEGYVTATLTPVVQDGQDFFLPQANGDPVVNQRAKPILRWYTVSIVFNRVDPELFQLMTGVTLLNDYTAGTPLKSGFVVTESNYATGNFGLEIWMGTADAECPEDGLVPYGWQLLPWVTEGAISGEIVVANDAISFTVTGRTRLGTPWGEGPYDVMLDAAGLPAPLVDPVPADTHYAAQWTYLPPPEAECGCQELES